MFALMIHSHQETDFMGILGFTGSLLLYHFLQWVFPIFFVLFVVVPWFMGIFNGKGYGFNVKEVGHGCIYVLSLGFKKRSNV